MQDLEEHATEMSPVEATSTGSHHAYCNIHGASPFVIDRTWHKLSIPNQVKI